jgi:hypothetical protein
MQICRPQSMGPNMAPRASMGANWGVRPKPLCERRWFVDDRPRLIALGGATLRRLWSRWRCPLAKNSAAPALVIGTSQARSLARTRSRSAAAKHDQYQTRRESRPGNRIKPARLAQLFGVAKASACGAMIGSPLERELLEAVVGIEPARRLCRPPLLFINQYDTVV